jgi:glutamate carboxypeptidase
VKAEAKARLAYFVERREEIVATIREFVEIESPSDNKASVDRIAEAVANRFSRLGGTLQIHPSNDFGNHLQVDFPGESSRRPVLLLGHYDTVYPVGTLAKMPCRVADAKLTGPGVLDMKLSADCNNGTEECPAP